MKRTSGFVNGELAETQLTEASRLLFEASKNLNEYEPHMPGVAVAGWSSAAVGGLADAVSAVLELWRSHVTAAVRGVGSGQDEEEPG